MCILTYLKMMNLFFTKNTLELDTYLATKKCVIIADARTNGFCVPVAKKILPALQQAQLIVIPAGEENKNLDTVHFIWEQLCLLQIKKNSLIINIGGGCLSDIASFAASTYKRGLEFINIPTTLLSMVDASIGGKNGINFNGIKNCIGLIIPAKKVYINPIFINSLPEREIKSGIVEMVKHSLLSSQSDWQKALHNNHIQQWCNMDNITIASQFKNSIVLQDELDEGIRQSLNLGHSIGHAIESYSHESKNVLLHGEAIYYGIWIELLLSRIIYNLDTTIINQFKHLGEEVLGYRKIAIELKNLLPYLLADKKNSDTINMSLIAAPGQLKIKTTVSVEQVQIALEEYGNN
jgi:3-dehydroquinate synthase